MDVSPRHAAESPSPTLLPMSSAAHNHNINHHHHQTHSHGPNSNAQLAQLLSEAYRDIESLRKDVAQARKAAEKAERVWFVLGVADIVENATPKNNNSATDNGNGNTTTSTTTTSDTKINLNITQATLNKLVTEYEARIAHVEAERDAAEAKKREAVEAVRMLDDLLSVVEREGRACTKGVLADASVGSSSPSSALSRGITGVILPGRQKTGIMFPSLPGPGMSVPAPMAATGLRRARTPSIDGMYASAQPPNKRSRGETRDTRAAYSESYIPSSTHDYPRPFPPPPQPQSQRPPPVSEPRVIDRKYRSHSQQQQQASSTVSHHHSHSHSQHIPSGNAPGQSNSHSRSGSNSSASSLDVDEMILKATTGDEGAGTIINGLSGPGSTANGIGNNGRAYIDSPHHPSQTQTQHQYAPPSSHHAQQIMADQMHATYNSHSDSYSHSRRRSSSSSRRGLDRDRERDKESPYPQSQSQAQTQYIVSSTGGPARILGGNGSGGGAGGGQGGSNASAPVVGGGGGSNGNGTHVYTTHVFAPVQTGAPTKKSKYSAANSASAGVGSTNIDLPASSSLPSLSQNATSSGTTNLPSSNAALIGSSSTLAISSTAGTGATSAPTAPFPSTNERGQRICRQCGIVGRYKDGKCVEKWGPGPCGPGTVCDRCRKKMKRVERRGTLEIQQQQQQQALLLQQAQRQQRQPRANQLDVPPSSQASDRSIHRSDTLPAHPTNHSQASFSSSRNDFRDRDRDDFRPMHPQAVSGKSSQRHQPTPPSIVALQEPEDEDDDDFVKAILDKDQLPTSNVGRGRLTAGAVAAHSSRSSSKNGRNARGSGKGESSLNVNSGGSSLTLHNKRSPLAGRGSGSPRTGNETDADAEADGEADAEAEILGAVDAASVAQDLEGDGDGEGELENDEDAEAELLEAVDAAEANSNGSVHGGERWLKSEA